MATEAGGGGLLPQYPSLSVTANYPRTFTFAEWIEPFKAMATINKWDDAAKLLWLCVQLVGGTQAVCPRKRKRAVPS